MIHSTYKNGKPTRRPDLITAITKVWFASQTLRKKKDEKISKDTRKNVNGKGRKDGRNRQKNIRLKRCRLVAQRTAEYSYYTSSSYQRTARKVKTKEGERRA